MVVLLATPAATALSRNIAFPMLMLTAALLILGFAREFGGNKALARARQFWRQVTALSPVGLIAILIVVFAFASVLWAPESLRGLRAAAQTTAAVMATVVGCVLIAGHTTAPRWLNWAFPLSVALASLLILNELSFCDIERSFCSPIRSMVGASPEPYRLNRAAIAIALLLPLLFLLPMKNRVMATLLIVFFALSAVFMSQSESAKLVAYTMTALAPLSIAVPPRLLAVVVGLFILASHVLAPAIALALYASVTPETVASLSSFLTTHPHHYIRLEIWWAYAQQILDAPIVGHGLQASSWADQTYTGSDPLQVRGLAFSHPHNVSLQTWYELGVVGVILSTALMAFLLRQIVRLRETPTRIAVILMASVWAIAYVSHGAWQGWWWALVGIITILFTALSDMSDRPA